MAEAKNASRPAKTAPAMSAQDFSKICEAYELPTTRTENGNVKIAWTDKTLSEFMRKLVNNPSAKMKHDAKHRGELT